MSDGPQRINDRDMGLPKTLLDQINRYREFGPDPFAPVEIEPGPDCPRCEDHHALAIRDAGSRLTTYIDCPDCATKRTAERRIMQVAAVPPAYQHTFDDYARHAPKGSLKYAATAREWAQSGEGSIMFQGNTGVLKTTLASAAYLWRIENRDVRSAEWTKAAAVIAEIRRSYDRDTRGPTATDILERLRVCDLLLLDDVGAVAINDKNAAWVHETLNTILDWRHDWQLPCIFTSNLSVAHLKAQLGDAIVSRIVGMCGGGSRVVVMDAGKDLRYS